MDKQVEDFKVQISGVAILSMAGQLKLSKTLWVNLHNLAPETIQWTIFERSSDKWLIGGDTNQNRGRVLPIDDEGKLSSSLQIFYTTNSHKGFASMYSIKLIIKTHGCSISLVLERDSYFHIVSLNTRGQLAIVDSIGPVYDKSLNLAKKKMITLSYTKIDEFEYLVAGIDWMRRLSFKLI